MLNRENTLPQIN